MKQLHSDKENLLDNFTKREFPHSILLVEDDSQQNDYLGQILERAGFHIIKTNNAAMALKVLQTASPDLILSDLNMPGIDGIEFCKQVYLRDCCLGIPFVIISAIHDTIFKRQASDAGAIDYIFKPFSPEKLIESLKSIFERIDKNNLVEVIYISDNPQYILGDEHYYRENGIIVNTLSNPQDALEHIHSKKWDMILSDIKGDVSAKFSICKKLKKDVYKTIPFIMLSENISSNIFEQGIKAGVTDFWNKDITVHEIISKIKSVMRKKAHESFYPRGVYAKMDDMDAIGAAQMMSVKKQTGIMSFSNAYMHGHMHFFEGTITEAWVDGYQGIEAFYTLMSMCRGGSYTIIKTLESKKAALMQESQNVFTYAKKLKNEIQKIWNAPVVINKTFPYEASTREKLFLKAAENMKNFRHIINELRLSPYHGFLILEKLMDQGIIVSPVKEHSLMEYSNV